MIHGKALLGLLLVGSATVVTGTPPRPPAPPPVFQALPVLPKPAVTWVSSPNADERTDPEGVTALVIHDTQTPGVTKAQTIANHFANPRSEAAAHFIIGKSGEIIQCVAESRRAWHVGPSLLDGVPRVNDFSIGVELVNAEDGRDPFTVAQYTSLTGLSAHLVSRYRIPIPRIVGHRDVAMPLGRKHDPADNFDWPRFRCDLTTRLNAAGYPVRTAAGP
jgi:N-acetylmuramoyl-L-alanine amidase